LENLGTIQRSAKCFACEEGEKRVVDLEAEKKENKVDSDNAKANVNVKSEEGNEVEGE